MFVHKNIDGLLILYNFDLGIKKVLLTAKIADSAYLKKVELQEHISRQ